MNNTPPNADPVLIKPGPLAWFATNHVAANLLMALVIIAGLLSLARIQIEVFPEIDINWVVVSVPYPGASPEEVEKSICLRVEEAVREVDNVKQVRSLAMEHAAMIMVELETYADNRKALDDVKNAVDRITTFPANAEQPIISIPTLRQQVLSMAIYGDVSQRTLKELAERVREDLTTNRVELMVAHTRPWWSKMLEVVRPRQGISTVSIDGIPPYEIAIEVSEESLRKYGMNFDQVAAAVRGSSLDLPAGAIKTEGGEILLRTTGQMYRGPEFEDIVVLTRQDGTVLRVRDVAKVIDGFEDTDRLMRFDGKPAVVVQVYAVGRQGALDVADTIYRYTQAKSHMLPEGVEIGYYLDRSTFLKDRIFLLLRNAVIGLTLVFLCLALFLDLRLAFWTTMGIPMSFLGAFILIPNFDVSINMISLFAFIIVLGIVVDAAIVVGENIFAHRQKGMPGHRAAILGVREMVAPVTMAIATTIAAFLPLVIGEGVWGQILRVVPLVVISVLLISMVQAFWILPAHLSLGKLGGRGGPVARLQSLVRRGLNWFIVYIYTPVLRCCIRVRYVSAAVALAVLMTTLGFVRGGHIDFEFFPQIEADNIVASVTMPQGTPVEQTRAIVERFETAARQVEREFQPLQRDGTAIYQHMITNIGGHPMSDEMTERGGGVGESRSGSHLGEVNIELLNGEHRDVSAMRMLNRWRELVGEVPGVTALTFTAEFFASDAISLELSHTDSGVLRAAADDLTRLLEQYDGVTDISDNLVDGKRQMEVVDVTPMGHAQGVRKETLARQLRAAFYGHEAQRIQRGRDEVRVFVRYPEAQRRSIGDLETMRVRLADGTELPFMNVAEIREGRGYAVIYRTDGRRTVSVIAEVNREIANADVINKDLMNRVMPELLAKYPDLTYDMEGEQKERDESMSSLGRNFMIAMLAIFGLLAVQFRSYAQPFIIMTAIPFGIVGAILGHVLMGLPLSFMTFFGVVALTGVVVNNSLIMIDLINRMRIEEPDLSVMEVIEASGIRRFRPILLTTLTTFFGLMPMIMEKSIQAQFLIPMAVSLGFGVVFSTVITLLIVPVLYVILIDLRRLVLGRERADILFHERADANMAT